MKTTTKFFAIAAVALATFASTGLKAQTMGNMYSNKGVRFGIGISGGITDDDSAFKNGLGADLRFQFDLSNYVSITATGGYTRLTLENGGDPYEFIPAKGGVKVFPIKGFYGLGEAGAGFGIKKDAKTSLIWSGGVGYEWTSGLDISARYEGYSQDSSSNTYVPYTGQYALRLAYSFKL